ncbi:pyruvate kinase [candidate division KSB1 bacterium]
MKKKSYERRAKIICTLGPSSNSYSSIIALANAGMNVARLNFSHGTHEQHAEKIDILRKVSFDIGRPIGILLDLQGPKIRVQKFKDGEVFLKGGQEFVLTTRDVVGDDTIVSVSYPDFHNDVEPGEQVLLDDGNLRMTVDEISGQDVHCIVDYGGRLKDHKGLNLPGSVLSVDALTDKDKDDLEFGLKKGVDFVALSFVQQPEDIIMIKDIISGAGHSTPVIAKIEKPQAVERIKEIAEVTDMIMIARGDLGVEMATEEVPPIQKRIIRICNDLGVPVITATQMLESMIDHPRPTRAEAADVANAILDGSDAVMLSGETAAGKYPVDAAETMSRIVTLIESDTLDKFGLHRRKPDWEYPTPVAIGYSACNTAQMVKAKAIICLTQSGSTALMIARFRPETPIHVVTPRIDTYFRTALIWGVKVHHTEDMFPDHMDDAIHHVFIMLKDRKVVKKGDKVVITAGIPFDKVGCTNMLRIEEVW